MRSEWLEEARSAWRGAGQYRIAWSDGCEDWTCDGPMGFDTVEELADELGAARSISSQMLGDLRWK